VNDPVENNVEWYRKLVDAYKNLLTSEEKAQLHEWEKEHLGSGNIATSDWPGWEKHIGLPPWRVGSS